MGMTWFIHVEVTSALQWYDIELKSILHTQESLIELSITQLRAAS